VSQIGSFWRGIIVFVLTIACLAVYYPLAFVVQHGFDPTSWHDALLLPQGWFEDLQHKEILPCIGVYVDMVRGEHRAFADGGVAAMAILALGVVGGGGFFVLSAPRPGLRDPRTVLGSARFANAAERAAMARGLELGLDPITSQPVRVQVEGNLLSIAPPRTGKTSGLIIPNLAMPRTSASGTGRPSSSTPRARSIVPSPSGAGASAVPCDASIPSTSSGVATGGTRSQLNPPTTCSTSSTSPACCCQGPQARARAASSSATAPPSSSSAPCSPPCARISARRSLRPDT
jgi:hypothetical protein